MLLLMLACAPDRVGSPVTTDPEEAETEWIQDLEIAPVEGIGTTLAVSFVTPVEGPAWAEYRVDGGDWEQTPPLPAGTQHRLAVLGAPYAEVTVKVVASLDGALRESGLVAVDAGGLLPEAPDIEVTIADYTPPQGELLLLSVFGQPAYVMMMAFDGTVRWAHPHNNITKAESGLAVAQARRDPGELWLNVFTLGAEYNHDAEMRRMNLFGEVTNQITTPGAHHYFTELPDGDLLLLQYDVRTVNGVETVGDALLRQPTNGDEPVQIANLWDLLPDPQPDAGADLYDWTHANWVLYSPERDSVLVSTADTNVLFEFDTEGALLQHVNGFQAPISGYHYTNASETFDYPHGVHWDQDGEELLMLYKHNGISAAGRYALDEDSRQISRVWSYGAELRKSAQVLGEVQELADGNLLVSWGGLGILQVVSPHGEVMWEARTDFGRFFSHATPITDPYNAGG